MYGLSRYVQEITGLKVRQNQGIVGEDINKIESGIITDWYYNAKDVAPLELSPYLYGLTGHPDVEIVMGKGSGLTTIDIALDKLGLVVEDPDVKMAILMAVKERSMEKHGLVSPDEFDDIAHVVTEEFPKVWKLRQKRRKSVFDEQWRAYCTVAKR